MLFECKKCIVKQMEALNGCSFWSIPFVEYGYFTLPACPGLFIFVAADNNFLQNVPSLSASLQSMSSQHLRAKACCENNFLLVFLRTLKEEVPSGSSKMSAKYKLIPSCLFCFVLSVCLSLALYQCVFLSLCSCVCFSVLFFLNYL